MAERSRGGGFGWFVVGVLAGIALTLGVLAFVNLRGHRTRVDASSGADEAAAAMQPGQAPLAAPVAAPPPPAPAPRTTAAAVNPPTAADAAAQSAQDAQIQDDAAATGDTARARPPQ
jgi:cytoskeletal protein RodZ